MQDFDIFIPVATKDVNFFSKVVKFNLKKINFNNSLYLLSEKEIPNLNYINVDENVFPFSKNSISKQIINPNRSGWIYQQVCKIYFVSNVTKNKITLVLDSDLLFTKKINFFTAENKPIYTTGDEYNIAYFEHMKKLYSGLERVDMNLSGISHHMIFNKDRINELINIIEKEKVKDFYDVFIESLDFNISNSPCSEYEIYFNFMLKYYPEEIAVRNLQWRNVDVLKIDHFKFYNYISLPDYVKTRPIYFFKHLKNLNLKMASKCIKNFIFLNIILRFKS